jgi:hypothetical protein
VEIDGCRVETRRVPFKGQLVGRREDDGVAVWGRLWVFVEVAGGEVAGWQKEKGRGKKRRDAAKEEGHELVSIHFEARRRNTRSHHPHPARFSITTSFLFLLTLPPPPPPAAGNPTRK